MKRYLFAAVAIVLAMCLSLSGCQQQGQQGGSGSAVVSSSEEGRGEQSFILPYTATDSLNPYSAKTKSNQELGNLLFDPLVKVKADFSLEYLLAEKIEVNATNCTVRLRNASFSDGSAVTAEDVTFSLRAAKASTTSKYAAQLANVASVSAASAKVVSLTLSKPDKFAANLLDFPIIKANSDNNKTSDNKALPPTGSGRYVYSADSTSYWLTANPSWQGGTIGIGRIELENLPDDEALEHSIEMGGLSFYYTNLGDGLYPNMSGHSVAVPMQNLVYLGVNPTKGQLGNAKFRHALSIAIGRDDIVKNVYYGSAVAATGPYHAAYSTVEGVQSLPVKKNVEQAVADLGQLGYNNKDTDGYLIDAGKKITFTLVCNEENAVRLSAANLIASAFKAVGIQLQVKKLKWADYTAALAAGNFDLYLAEMKIPNNFDLFPMVTSAYGVAADSATYLAAQKLNAGTGSVEEVISCMNEDMLLIPLCHRSGVITHTAALTGTLTPDFSDIFAGLEDCTLGS